MKNKRYRGYLKPAIGLVAIGLIYVGDKLALSSMQAIGAAVLGLGLIGVGIDSIRTRNFNIGVNPGSLRSSNRFRFKGAGAVFRVSCSLPWGLEPW